MLKCIETIPVKATRCPAVSPQPPGRPPPLPPPLPVPRPPGPRLGSQSVPRPVPRPPGPRPGSQSVPGPVPGPPGNSAGVSVGFDWISRGRIFPGRFDLFSDGDDKATRSMRRWPKGNREKAPGHPAFISPSRLQSSSTTFTIKTAAIILSTTQNRTRKITINGISMETVAALPDLVSNHLPHRILVIKRILF